ncbi:MAG: TetR/AcrR family transcriptional regulator [Pseudomonadota bacterium]
MNLALKEGVIARQPQRVRTRARFDQVLDAAEALVCEEGLSGFSIPVLAERLGYTRASIYKFFPTPYAVLNELAQRQLSRLEERLTRRAASTVDLSWQDAMRAISFEAVDFYNETRIARLLLLGAPVTDDSYRALELLIQRLGGLTRQIMEPRGIFLPTTKPDAATLMVELGTSCFRVSQFLHGEITPEYRDEAVRAMAAYLGLYVEGQNIAPVTPLRLARAISKGRSS